MNRSLAVLCVLSISIICLAGCITPSDNALIKTEFDRWSPGYSSIEVLRRQGEGTPSNPRILTIQATINSYPHDVVCEGELVFFHSDPSYLQMRWYTLEGIGHAYFVQLGSTMLKRTVRYVPGRHELLSLLLKRWVENDLINLDDIESRQTRDIVKSWIENPAGQPIYEYRDAGLFDTRQIKTYDLAPELPDDQKVPIHILLDNGLVELYFVNKATYWEYELGEELPNGIILPNPIPKPANLAN